MKRNQVISSLWLCGLVCVLVFSLPLKAQTRPAVSLPTVSGPLAVTDASHPMNAAKFELTPEDLSKVGYVEEEYLLSGTANVYDDVDGRIAIKATGASYTTRILVRRPNDPKKFSGSIITGPMNPSTNVDLVDPWMNARRYIVEHGDVYIGITSKPVDIVSLKKFDPDRYGSLTMTEPQSGCSSSPGAVPGMENGLIWDMLSQLGALLKSDSTPLKGFQAKYLYMSGGSQTGGYTIRYINSFHKRSTTEDGKPIYDGYLPFIAAGMAPINQCPRPVSPADQQRYITQNITSHVGVPVIRIMSQTDYGGGAGALGAGGRGGGTLSLRRADSDNPDDPYRLYELPGTSHVVLFGLAAFPRPEDFIKSGNQPFVYDCAEPIGIDGRMYAYIFDGAFANLDRWVRTGQVPPRADTIWVDATGTGISDKFGNLLGGVRTPDVDVPIATYIATSTATNNRGAGGGCGAMGHEIPFSAERLKELYPTHADYVNKVDADVDRMLREGWLTKSDAEQIKADAAKSPIPGAK